MTITSETNIWGPYAGDNGGNQDFTVGDKFITDTDLTVIQTDSLGVETTLTLTTHYTVAGAGEASGGTVTVIAAVPTDETITIKDEIPYTQTVALPLGGAFPSTSVETALDRVVKQVQRVKDDIATGGGVAANVGAQVALNEGQRFRFTTELYDTQGEWDTGLHIFTPSREGVYTFNVRSMVSSTNGKRQRISLAPLSNTGYRTLKFYGPPVDFVTGDLTKELYVTATLALKDGSSVYISSDDVGGSSGVTLETDSDLFIHYVGPLPT